MTEDGVDGLRLNVEGWIGKMKLGTEDFPLGEEGVREIELG